MNCLAPLVAIFLLSLSNSALGQTDSPSTQIADALSPVPSQEVEFVGCVVKITTFYSLCRSPSDTVSLLKKIVTVDIREVEREVNVVDDSFRPQQSYIQFVVNDDYRGRYDAARRTDGIGGGSMDAYLSELGIASRATYFRCDGTGRSDEPHNQDFRFSVMDHHVPAVVGSLEDYLSNDCD